MNPKEDPMRRSVVLLLAVVAVAACTPNHKPYQPPTDVPLPSQEATAPAPDITLDPSATPLPPSVPAEGVVPGDPSTWIVIAPDGKGFSVKMPGNPAASDAKVKTPAGDLTITTWTYAPKSGAAMAVSTSKFAPGALGTTTAKSVYDTALGMFAQQSGGKLASQKDVTVGGKPARSFVITSASFELQGVLVLVGETMYMAYVGNDPDKVDQAIVDAFIASFALTA
jgi:hypothetical protein